MVYTGSIPDTAVRRLDWQEAAGCRTDPDLFFDTSPRREQEARTVCVARCPVRTQCAAAVKEAERGKPRKDRHGVIAGLTDYERWRLDPEATRDDDDPPLLELDGSQECGTHDALLGHLWRGERVDDVCWSGQIARTHHNRSWRQSAEPQPKPKQKAKREPECGTEQALYLHRRHKTHCTVCDEAHAERIAARRREVLADEHVKGGSERGYFIHRRLGEQACEKCTAGARREREARLEREARQPKRTDLTTREQQVNDLWEQSLSDSEIARHIGISRAGVANIRRRLGLLNAPAGRAAS